ncbi:hypothetical protein CAEBREN_12352 [Caenorhabditis brenneri]|uniref:histone acetyltransferase n=1 Tax=Caenorhabditis brenneri TaxID=135651 RepID=G0N7G6_CAEBE|nr:hypothetical protein CAEBREN_12352 [Caenorhabditis brenneri]
MKYREQIPAEVKRIFKEAQKEAKQQTEMSRKELGDVYRNLEPETEPRLPRKIHFSKYLMETTYDSPFPLYICEFCMFYAREDRVMKMHANGKCPWRAPPGKEIYRKDNISIFEVDGHKQKKYCEAVSLLTRCFLSSKTNFWDPDLFLFYVIPHNDDVGFHFAGCFSKEKNDQSTNNLNCIVALPCYQAKGYGRFLIDVSYALSRKEQNWSQGPELPFSELGERAYASYWRMAVAKALAGFKDDIEGGDGISVLDITHATGINVHDVLATLEAQKWIKLEKSTNNENVGDFGLEDSGENHGASPHVDSCSVRRELPRYSRQTPQSFLLNGCAVEVKAEPIDEEVYDVPVNIAVPVFDAETDSSSDSSDSDSNNNKDPEDMEEVSAPNTNQTNRRCLCSTGLFAEEEEEVLPTSDPGTDHSSDSDLGNAEALEEAEEELAERRSREIEIFRVTQELERLRQKELAREKRNERDRKRRQIMSEEQDRQRQRRSEKDRANRQKKKEKKENLSTVQFSNSASPSSSGPNIFNSGSDRSITSTNSDRCHSNCPFLVCCFCLNRSIAAPVKPKVVRRRRRYSSNSESDPESESKDDICFLLFYSTLEINCIVFSICSSTHKCSSTTHPLHFPNSIPLQ